MSQNVQPATHPPDDGVVVLIGVPGAAEPVWPGYIEDGVWYWENGLRVPVDKGLEVVCWQDIPELPKEYQ